MAVGLSPLAVPVARADECFCLFDPTAQQFQVPYEIERLKNSGFKLVSRASENGYSFRLANSSANSDQPSQSLADGEVWRNSVDLDVTANFGTYVKTELHTNFTEAWRDPGSSLRNLQVLGEDGNGSRALSDFQFTTKFLDDRVMLSSSRQASTWMPAMNDRSEMRGVAENFRFKVAILDYKSVQLSVDGVSNRIDPDYWELTKTPTSDPLQAKNRATRQLRSSLHLGRFGLNVLTRESSVLVTENESDFHPRQTEMGATASVGLADLRNDNRRSWEDPLLFWVPDTVWIGRNQGSLQSESPHTAAASTVENFSAGATRAWGIGDISFGYWQSAIEASPLASASSSWGGHGFDLGGNLYFSNWLVYGNVSLYSADSMAAWNAMTEDSISGSLLVKWNPAYGPALSAGVTYYGYGLNMLDYEGLEGNNLWRYELALDFSRMATASLNRDLQLKLFTSFRSNALQSQWANARYGDATGSVFMGFRFGLPLSS